MRRIASLPKVKATLGPTSRNVLTLWERGEGKV